MIKVIIGLFILIANEMVAQSICDSIYKKIDFNVQELIIGNEREAQPVIGWKKACKILRNNKMPLGIQKIKGTYKVYIRVLITSKGEKKCFWVEKSDDKQLDEIAKSKIVELEMRPAQRNGKLVDAILPFIVEFK